MSKSTRLTLAQWTALRTRIKAEHGLGTVLVRSHMKDVMGFLPREHVYWSNRGTGQARPREVVEMHLDWYSEPKRTMFLLKYGDIIDSK